MYKDEKAVLNMAVKRTRKAGSPEAGFRYSEMDRKTHGPKRETACENTQEMDGERILCSLRQKVFNRWKSFHLFKFHKKK